MEKTRNGYDEIDKLIAEEQEQAPRVFPYSTRELSEKYGLSHMTINLLLHKRGLYVKNRRWYYRNIQEREHE